MKNSGRIAKPYAKALFDLSLEKGAVEKTYNDILTIQAVFEDNKELGVFLASPVIKAEKKHAVINEIFANRIEKLTSEFFNVLFARSREFIIKEIALAFEDLYNEHNGIAVAYVNSAAPLEAKQKEAIFTYFKGTNSKIKQLKVIEKVDPSLIGGFIATVDNKQVDKSVKTALSQVKSSFENRHYEKKY
ncbi:MAG: ATP synthase F1 subunit delta [Luteibaculaceae bacterium]